MLRLLSSNRWKSTSYNFYVILVLCFFVCKCASFKTPSGGGSRSRMLNRRASSISRKNTKDLSDFRSSSSSCSNRYDIKKKRIVPQMCVSYGDIETNSSQNNTVIETTTRGPKTPMLNWRLPFIKEDDEGLPTPLDKIVDVNKDRRSIVYEITLGRDIGFEILKGFDPTECAIVGEVTPLTKASQLGVMAGDIIVATSATAGDLMWSHSTADGVKSALSTRFVMSANVVIRFERFINKIDPELVPKLKVPFFYTVNLNRPIGLHVVEGPEKKVFVQYIKPQLGADRSRKVEVGDEIVAMKASWGDRLWEVNSVESFVMGVKMRTDAQLTCRFRRVVLIEDFMTRQVGSVYKMLIKQDSIRTTRYSPPASAADTQAAQFDLIAQTSSDTGRSSSQVLQSRGSQNMYANIGAMTTIDELKKLWKTYLRLQKQANRAGGGAAAAGGGEGGDEGYMINTFLANKLMTLALRLESPEIAIEIFETLFSFNTYYKTQYTSNGNGNGGNGRYSNGRQTMPSTAATKVPKLGTGTVHINPNMNTVNEGDEGHDGFVRSRSLENPEDTTATLTPNNFVCTTAVKAYGRISNTEKATAILPWMEKYETADVVFMTSLLYVCAKAKKVKDVERIFWKEIPARKLTYTVATINSLMYLYAKLNRADDVLRLYELIKESGLHCTEVTYGVVIKALVRTGKAQLQETALEVLKSLPSMAIRPGVEMYNQMLEYYASTHNYKQTKNVLRLMSHAHPRIKPNTVTYGYVIACFADSKKPRSALSAFYQMRKQKIKPNRHTYMGVLKALTHMRDAVSAKQVIQEMLYMEIWPDNRHYSMSMFACVVANQCGLAEEVIELYMNDSHHGPPDQAICTLWLRAYLQQGKWEEGMELLSKMKDGKEAYPKPNLQTYNYLLQYQIRNEMWTDATATLATILPIYSSPLSKVRMEGNMHGTVVALSFALGPYSSVVTRMNRQDYNSLQYTSSAVTTIVDSAQTVGDLPYASGAMVSGQPLSTVYGIDINEEENGDGGEEPKTQSAGLVVGSLAKPSVAAYRFLVSAVRLIGNYEFILLEVMFYKELLRALLLDGQPVLAEELLELRSKGKLKLKSDEDVVKIETLAAKALQKGLIVQSIERVPSGNS